MRNVVKREGGYWYSKMVRGTRKWINLQTKEYHEACRRAIEVAGLPGLIPSAPGELDSLVDQFIAFQLRQGYFTEQTAANRRFMLADFSRFLPATISVPKVTQDQVAEWYAGLRSRLTEATSHSYFYSLRAFFRWAIEVKRLRHDNPCSGVRLARLPARGRRDFISREEKENLIHNAKDEDMAFILFCGFDAGLRRGEICEARVNWFEAGKLQVRRTPTFTPKDRDERAIPLTIPFQTMLKSYLGDKKPNDFALHPEVGHGKFRYRYDFRRPFTNYVRAQGFPKLTPHVMRHSFASILAQQGVSIFKIAEWLGDDVRVVQRHYAKLTPDTDSDIHLLTSGSESQVRG